MASEKRKRDEEQVAMAAIVRLIEGLDGPARQRVVDYIAQRYAPKAGA